MSRRPNRGTVVLALRMAEEIRIEVWQEADKRAFERGLRQCIEILPKRCRRPTFHSDRRNGGLLACPDLTSDRECDAGPQSKVCGGCWPKRSQIRMQERPFGLLPRDILPVRRMQEALTKLRSLRAVSTWAIWRSRTLDGWPR